MVKTPAADPTGYETQMTRLDRFIASLPLCQLCAKVQKLGISGGGGNKQNGLASPLGR